MPETRGCSITSGSKPRGLRGSRAILNPRDPKAVLAEFTVFFLLPLSLTQSDATPWAKNNPWKGKKGEFRVEREDSIRIGPLV